MILEKGLDQPGTNLESIRESLGEPDDCCCVKLSGTDVLTTVYQYGLCLMYFEEEKLVSCKLIE